jgi:hypothetical protein
LCASLALPKTMIELFTPQGAQVRFPKQRVRKQLRFLHD